MPAAREAVSWKRQWNYVLCTGATRVYNVISGAPQQARRAEDKDAAVGRRSPCFQPSRRRPCPCHRRGTDYAHCRTVQVWCTAVWRLDLTPPCRLAPRRPRYAVGPDETRRFQSQRAVPRTGSAFFLKRRHSPYLTVRSRDRASNGAIKGGALCSQLHDQSVELKGARACQRRFALIHAK